MSGLHGVWPTNEHKPGYTVSYETVPQRWFKTADKTADKGQLRVGSGSHGVSYRARAFEADIPAPTSPTAATSMKNKSWSLPRLEGTHK